MREKRTEIASALHRAQATGCELFFQGRDTHSPYTFHKELKRCRKSLWIIYFNPEFSFKLLKLDSNRTKITNCDKYRKIQHFTDYTAFQWKYFKYCEFFGGIMQTSNGFQHHHTFRKSPEFVCRLISRLWKMNMSSACLICLWWHHVLTNFANLVINCLHRQFIPLGGHINWTKFCHINPG